jgi:hypothetical protein
VTSLISEERGEGKKKEEEKKERGKRKKEVKKERSLDRVVSVEDRGEMVLSWDGKEVNQRCRKLKGEQGQSRG